MVINKMINSFLNGNGSFHCSSNELINEKNLKYDDISICFNAYKLKEGKPKYPING